MSNTYSELIKSLKNTPYGSPSHAEAYNRLSKKYLKPKYGGQYILCSAGRFNQTNPTNKFMHSAGVTPLSDINNSLEGSLALPSDKLSVFETDFYFVEREYAEYNLDHLQVNVHAVIANEDMSKFILLKSFDGDLKLVGGHTDYHPEDYHVSIKDTLYRNMSKEIKEEIKNGDVICRHLDDLPAFKYLGHKSSNQFYDLFHAMYIYVIICDVDKVFNKIKTGEPDKHKVVLMTANEIKAHNKKKSAVKDMVEYLTQ